jgi:hypothetical protein
MLVQVDPALLSAPLHRELLNFLRRPFAEQSCAHVDLALPQIGPMYRAIAASRAAWEGAALASPLDDPGGIFMPVASIHAKEIPLLPLTLLATQVRLQQEDLRDYVERLRKHRGDAVAATLAPAQALLAVRAMSFHEATFLTLTGYFSVRTFDSLIEFALTPLGEACMHDRVISVIMQEQTENALASRMRSMIAAPGVDGSARQPGVTELITSAQLDWLEARLLDTFFSLSSLMQADPEVAPDLVRAKQLCRWFSVLQLVRLAGQDAFHPTPQLIQGLGLDAQLIQQVCAERRAALESDKGIYGSASGGLTLGATALGHAITCCKAAVISDAEAGRLGKQFEAHVYRYVRDRVPAADYLIRRGVEQSPKDDGPNFDCDLILVEPGRRQIFFLQIKWKRAGRTASLDDEMNDWRGRNWPMHHGVAQIAGLRKRLSEPGILAQVAGRLTGLGLSERDILANAHFLVIHTAPHFSPYMMDGIAIYEWNLFRNLLLRQAIDPTGTAAGKGSGPARGPDKIPHGLLPLEDPGRIGEHYLAMAGYRQETVATLMRERLEARYGFDLARPALPFWRRLIGKPTIRVVRPYT